MEGEAAAHHDPTATALVTGASRGIGKAIASALHGVGYRVVLSGRDDAALHAVAAELALRPGAARVQVCALDLRAPSATEELLASARALGNLTVLVNNAGTAPSAAFERTSGAVLDEVLDLHVRMPFRLTQGALPDLLAHKGCVVQLASTAGLRGFPFTTAYTAAKHGMVGFTRALHEELHRRGVGVYALCPGFVDTDITRGAAAAVAARGKISGDEAFAKMAAMNRLGRMHVPEEVAQAVAMLVTTRPEGCVLDLDWEHPRFV